jgi:hypothetical protein
MESLFFCVSDANGNEVAQLMAHSQVFEPSDRIEVAMRFQRQWR